MEAIQSSERHRRRRDIGRFIGITIINASLMVFSGVRGVSTLDGALLAEMSHDLGDAAVGGARTYAFWKRLPEQRLYTFRRATYSVVCTLGVLTGIKSGIDLFSAVRDFNGWNDISENIDNIVNGLVIASGSEGAYALSQQLESADDLAHDAIHHARTDRDTSLFLAGAIVVGSVVPFVAEAGGALVGGYTAWHMRPTSKNLETHTH